MVLLVHHTHFQCLACGAGASGAADDVCHIQSWAIHFNSLTCALHCKCTRSVHVCGCLAIAACHCAFLACCEELLLCLQRVAAIRLHFSLKPAWPVEVQGAPRPATGQCTLCFFKVHRCTPGIRRLFCCGWWLWWCSANCAVSRRSLLSV